jgi:hypothetical protein
MKLNESGLDRVIRALVGVIFIALGWTGVAAGVLGTILIVVGAVLLLTGLVGFCPLYMLLGIRTNKA